MSSMRIQGRTVLSSGQPMVATVAEGAGEAFMNVTDSHFSFRGDGVWPSYVPMFESIYADYIRPFGSKGIDAVSSRTAAASAQQFAYGGHIGRVAYGDATAPVPANYPSTLYAKDLGKYREALLPFLGFGEMARPPALTYGSSVAASNPSALATNGTLVVSSAWRTVDPSIHEWRSCSRTPTSTSPATGGLPSPSASIRKHTESQPTTIWSA